MTVQKGCHLALYDLELAPRVRDVMGHSASALMIENACGIEYEQCSLVLKDLA